MTPSGHTLSVSDVPPDCEPAVRRAVASAAAQAQSLAAPVFHNTLVGAVLVAAGLANNVLRLDPAADIDAIISHVALHIAAADD